MAGEADAAASAALSAKDALLSVAPSQPLLTIDLNRILVFGALIRTGKINDAAELLPSAIEEVFDNTSSRRATAERLLIGPLVEGEQFRMAAAVLRQLATRGENDRYFNLKGTVLWELRALAKNGRDKEARIGAQLLASIVDGPSASASVALGLIDAGKLDQAEILISTLTNNSLKAMTLAALATRMAEANGAGRAGKIAASSLELASRVTDDEQPLVDAADAIVAAPVVAETLAAVTKARVSVKYRDGNRYPRLSVLLALGPALRKAGDAEAARAVAREAFDLARPRKDQVSSEDDENARAAARMLVESVDPLEVIRLATAIDPKVHLESEHPKILAVVAEALASAGHATAATTAAKLALAAASKVSDDELRSSAHLETATAFAAVRLYRQAREAAELCTSSDDKLGAYVAIMQQRAIQADPSMARLLQEPPITTHRR